MRALSSITLVMLLLPVMRAETTPQRLLKEALQEFDAGNAVYRSDRKEAASHYEKAAALMRRIVEDHHIVNGKLLYNIGNAYLLSGKTGMAILFYKCASYLMPRNPQLQHNLETARRRCREKAAPPSLNRAARLLLFWHYDFPARLKLPVGIFLLNTGILLSLLLMWRSIPYAETARWIMLSAAMVLIGSSLLELHERRHTVEGVIVAREVIARKGDSLSYSPAFEQPLCEGVEFTLLEERRGWLHIQLADGKTCWVPRSSAVLTKDILP